MIVQQPRRLDATAVPPVPQGMAPEPSPLALVHGQREGQWWWTLLRKVSYGIGDDGRMHRAVRQEPIHTRQAPHDPLPDWLGADAGRKGSMKTVAEARAFQSGTDVVVRGHAASAEPVTDMVAGVAVAGHTHKLRVWGARRSVLQGGRVHFTPPEPFQRVPLRSELAYGGFDPVALNAALDEMARRLGPLAWRRGAAFLKDIFPATVPIAYARNPVGMGYVADPVPQALHDVALPRIELARDLLTPERFAQGQPLAWLSRPVPAGLDFMDTRMFPRTAMLGLPPPGLPAGSPACAEVDWGQVPQDFSRGNLMSADEAQLQDVLHPDAGRCAPIGLRLPGLSGREVVSLIGLRADMPRWDFALPAERPAFEVPGQGVLPSALWQVFIDADARRAELLWAASWAGGRELAPGEGRALLPKVGTRVEVLA